jgi:hypothetical protein
MATKPTEVAGLNCPVGHENVPGAKFCAECGSALSEMVPCASGHQNLPGQKFCGECGERLGQSDSPETRTETSIDALDEVVAVELLDAAWQPENRELGRNDDLVGLTFRFENRSAKDVRAVGAEVIFLDLFGRTKRTVTLTADTKVLPGMQTVEDDSWSFKVNRFIDDDAWFMNHRFEDMKVMVIVRAILFVDGSLLGDPNIG